MTEREIVKALLDRAYEARSKGDIEGVMAVFALNVKFIIAGAKEVTSVAGSVEGHEKLRPAITQLISSFELLERDILSVVIEGGSAAVHSRVKLRFIPKDKTMTTEMLDLWKTENGKVSELVEFVDTALLNDLMR